MTRILKSALPLTVVAVGALTAFAMILSRREPETRVPDVPAPLVRVQEVGLTDVRLVVRSQGTVSPRTESVLVPEVAGQVIAVAPAFASGGFFEEGDVLLSIDPLDYREAVVRARAAVAQAELRLSLEQAESDVARREWEDLGNGDPSPLTLREPQLADAEASRDAAKAALERAERDLDRTEIRAPYAGRIRSKQVDVGQYVTPGTPLANVYSVDYAEVRLPLPDDDLAFIDLPLVYRGNARRGPQPEVTLRARFAGRAHEWTGRIVRTEGEIDARSRMVHAVARVKDPYAHGSDRDRPPLAAGLFVEAEILGHLAERVAVIPRSAVRDDGQVLVVDADSRLRFRRVEILRRQDRDAIVRSGLEEGELVCLSPLVAVTDGMRVRTENPGS